MKKVIYALLLLSILFLSACNPIDSNQVLLEFKEELTLPEVIDEDYPLAQSYSYQGQTIIATWESTHEDVMTCQGIIKKGLEEKTIELTVTLSLDTHVTTKNFTVVVAAFDDQERLDYVANTLLIPDETNKDIVLPKSIDGVIISWSSTHPLVLSSNGKYTETESSTNVSLTALLFYNGETITKVFEVTALAPSAEQRVQTVYQQLTIPSTVSSSLNLATIYNTYVHATWESSHPEIIRNDGIVYLDQTQHTVTLTVQLSYGGANMTKTFTVLTTAINEGETYYPFHTYIDRASSLEDADNLIQVDDKLELTTTDLSAQYESEIVTTNQFASLVASFSAITNTTNSVDLQVRVRVNGTWSDYFSYGEFSLGKENKATSVNVAGAVARLSIDELIVNGGLKADAFQYKVVLSRNTLLDPSPKLSMVAVTLDIPEYHYAITSELPDFVDHVVPQLNQNIVPVIGNSICSPTSITMLLKFKGHSFSEYDEYEHRYIANITKDYGHNIFGNWVFNTNTMGAYGHDSYVKRMYSFKELQHHLHTVGPVAASVKGDMQGLYTTNGHLIVVRGYRVTDNGIKVITNDPNLSNVYYEYDLSTFLNVWRNIVYVIE